MQKFPSMWICVLLLVQLALVAGQQRLSRTEFFLPRTQQNAKRVQQRFSQLERLKQMSGMKVGSSGGNGWNNNNGGGGVNGGGGGGGGWNNGVVSSGGSGFHRRQQLNLANLNAEQLEALMDHRRIQMEMGMGMGLGMGMGMGIGTGMGMSGGGMGSRNGGYTYINVEAMSNAAEMGIMPSMMMRNNGGMGRNRQGTMGNNNNGGKGGMNNGRGGNGRRRKIKLPPCQPLYECIENFIPPQCRSWRYDTSNGMMCRSCPINTCQGGAKEMFTTMYERHPKRLMFEALTRR